MRVRQRRLRLFTLCRKRTKRFALVLVDDPHLFGQHQPNLCNFCFFVARIVGEPLAAASNVGDDGRGADVARQEGLGLGIDRRPRWTEWRGGWLGWKGATRATRDPRHPQENSAARRVLTHSLKEGVRQSSRELRNDELELLWAVLRSQLALRHGLAMNMLLKSITPMRFAPSVDMTHSRRTVTSIMLGYESRHCRRASRVQRGAMQGVPNAERWLE